MAQSGHSACGWCFSCWTRDTCNALRSLLTCRDSVQVKCVKSISERSFGRRGYLQPSVRFFCCAQVQQTLTVVVRQGTVPSKLMISSYPTSLMQPNCTLKSPDCCYRNLFLPCDAMRKRGTIRRQVSLSVRHTRLLHQSGYRQAYHRTLWPDSLITLVS